MQNQEPKATSQPKLRKVDSSPYRLRVYRLLRRMLIGFLLVSIVNLIFSSLFYTPKASRIDSENRALIDKYNLLLNRVSATENRLAQISHRDNYVYRSLFGLDTLDQSRDREPYPKIFYDEYAGNLYSPLIISAWERMDIFAKELYNQSLSLDELQLLAKNKEELSSSIPAVWPIDRTALKYGIGAFGMRLHPIYRRYIMHKGIDLAADTGTKIYATGDAVVEKSQLGYRRSGYGQMLLLRHKFGYQTRYAHLSKRLVNVGDTVRRGDVIGLVGSTGGSTGPHLHYEVILRGQVVNPLNFFNRNMSKEEYEKLMEQVHETKLEKFDE